MNEIVVSVCITTFNHENFIRQCVESVLKQKTSFNFEIIVVDDCSTDSTYEILKDIARNTDIKITVNRNEVNKFWQYSPCMMASFCFNITTGRYIALLEGDDYWISEDKLQRQYDFLERNKSFSGSYHNTLRLESGFDKTSGSWREDLKDIIKTSDLFTMRCPIHTSSIMFRKEHYPEKVPNWCYDAGRSGDFLIFYIISKSGPIGLVQDIDSVYRCNPNSITHHYTHESKLFNLARIRMLEHFMIDGKGLYMNEIQDVQRKHIVELLTSFSVFELLRMFLRLGFKKLLR